MTTMTTRQSAAMNLVRDLEQAALVAGSSGNKALREAYETVALHLVGASDALGRLAAERVTRVTMVVDGETVSCSAWSPYSAFDVAMYELDMFNLNPMLPGRPDLGASPTVAAYVKAEFEQVVTNRGLMYVRKNGEVRP